MERYGGIATQAGAATALVLGFATVIEPWLKVVLLLVMILLGVFQIIGWIRRIREVHSLKKELLNLRAECSKAASNMCPLEKRVKELEKQGVKLS